MANAKTKATPQPGIVEVSLNVDDLDALNGGDTVSVRNGRYTIVLTPDMRFTDATNPGVADNDCAC